MTLRERAEAVWSKKELERLDSQNLESFEFSAKTIETLCTTGLPRWCAPNMNLHPKESFVDINIKEKHVTLGSDRDNNSLVLNFKNETVNAIHRSGRVWSVAPNIKTFLELLITYAEFIEAYIANHSDFNFSNEFADKAAIEGLISDLNIVCPNIIKEQEWWSNHLTLLLNQDPRYFTD